MLYYLVYWIIVLLQIDYNSRYTYDRHRRIDCLLVITCDCCFIMTVI